MKYFVTFLVIALLTIIFFQRCGNEIVKPPTPIIKIIHDTVHIGRDTNIFVIPVPIRTDTLPMKNWEVKYVPDTNHNALLSQYIQVTKDYLKSSYYSDSLSLGLNSYVIIKDTIAKGIIAGRSYKYKLDEIHINTTTTITNTLPPKRHLYIGGGIAGSKIQPIQQAEVGLLFLNKKKQIYGINVAADFNGNVIYGVKSYWNIF